MKSMKCNQLGGTCDTVFTGETFQEIAEQSKKHAMEMFQAGNQAHIHKMKEMQELMNTPEAMRTWFENKRKEFELLPEL